VCTPYLSTRRLAGSTHSHPSSVCVSGKLHRAGAEEGTSKLTLQLWSDQQLAVSGEFGLRAHPSFRFYTIRALVRQPASKDSEQHPPLDLVWDTWKRGAAGAQVALHPRKTGDPNGHWHENQLLAIAPIMPEELDKAKLLASQRNEDPSLGYFRFHPVHAPRCAVVWGQGTLRRANVQRGDRNQFLQMVPTNDYEN
jgi:hypothetical protein